MFLKTWNPSLAGYCFSSVSIPKNQGGKPEGTCLSVEQQLQQLANYISASYVPAHCLTHKSVEKSGYHKHSPPHGNKE